MAREHLSDRSVSVILQGTLRLDQPGIAQRALQSIRDTLPEAQIIVSHPDDEDPQGLIADRIANYEDPGADLCFCGKTEMNLSRQIVSMKAGLTLAERDFVLKFRPEFELTGARFVRSDPLGKIRVSNAFTHSVNKDLRYMHVSDVIQFGAFERILNFWSTETSREKIWRCSPSKDGAREGRGNGCAKLRPEQFLTLEYAEKNSNLDFNSLSGINVSFTNYKKTHSFVSTYFEIVPLTEAEIDGPRRFVDVSTQARYETSWQLKGPSIIHWLGSLVSWILSTEGMLITLRSIVRKMFPFLEERLSRALMVARRNKSVLKITLQALASKIQK